MSKPTVSLMVHYVSYGTPGGEYKSMCRAAVVTQVAPNNPDLVGLAVLNPGGLFFDVAVQYHEGDPAAKESIAAGAPTTPSYRGGTWHHICGI